MAQYLYYHDCICCNLNCLSYVYMGENAFELETLLSFFFLQFQIVSNTFRAHDLEKLFIKCSLQFQIISNSVSMYNLTVNVFKIVSGRPRVLIGMLRHGVMVPYHDEDPGVTTESIGVYTVHAGSATIA